MMTNLRSRLLRSESGAAAVEFAIFLPMLFMLAFGLYSTANSWNQTQMLTHAAREGSRYSVHLDRNAFGSGQGRNWAEAVALKTQESSDTLLKAPGSTICVSMVDGGGNNPPVSQGNGSTYQVTLTVAANGSNTFTSNGNACFRDSTTEFTRRTLVRVTRPGTLTAIMFTVNLTLTGDAVARYEGPVTT